MRGRGRSASLRNLRHTSQRRIRSKSQISLRQQQLQQQPNHSFRLRKSNNGDVAAADNNHNNNSRLPVTKSEEISCCATTRQQIVAALDEAIRGRLDGLDVLSLGPARFHSIPQESESRKFQEMSNWIDAINLQTDHSPVLDICRAMVDLSGGLDPPEIILEGYLPTERWAVKLLEQNTPENESTSLPSLSSTDVDEDEEDDHHHDHNHNHDNDKTDANHLSWGINNTPPPTHALAQKLAETEDDIFQMAAACSVPIDIDEEAFIIDTEDHLQAIHDIAVGTLQRRRYDLALHIFDKILIGVQTKQNSRQAYLIGSAHHNIGIVKIMMNNFEGALQSFQIAAQIRSSTLGTDHPDVGVSLFRVAICHFAMGNTDKAVSSTKEALESFETYTTARAKLLNNLGVLYFHQLNFIEAIKVFTTALEIQRESLQAVAVHRESTIYDVSTILCNMGKLFLRQGNFEPAFAVFEESLLLLQTTQSFHAQMLTSRGNLGFAKAKKGETKRAIQIYSGILRTQELCFGPESKEAMETMGILGYLYKQNQDWQDAMIFLSRVYEWIITTRGDEDMADMIKESLKKTEGRFEGSVSVWI